MESFEITGSRPMVAGLVTAARPQPHGRRQVQADIPCVARSVQFNTRLTFLGASIHFGSTFLSRLRMMLVGIWLGLYWVLFSFFDHRAHSKFSNIFKVQFSHATPQLRKRGLALCRAPSLHTPPRDTPRAPFFFSMRVFFFQRVHFFFFRVYSIDAKAARAVVTMAATRAPWRPRA